jgi:hypothetical protein
MPLCARRISKGVPNNWTSEERINAIIAGAVTGYNATVETHTCLFAVRGARVPAVSEPKNSAAANSVAMLASIMGGGEAGWHFLTEGIVPP